MEVFLDRHVETLYSVSGSSMATKKCGLWFCS
jgi:hypothetical protein